MHEAIDGIVIRVRDMGDRDRYLTVLTAERGRITILSKGGRSVRSNQIPVSQLFTYANFEYYRRGDFNILKGGTAYQPFYALGLNIDRLNLASYLCDVTREMTDEGEEAEDILRLLLNCIYAISHDLYPQYRIKAAFELRMAAMSGYAPDLDGCTHCGASDREAMYLDVMNGALVCSECISEHTPKQRTWTPSQYDDIREASTLCPLTPAALNAMRYVLLAPIERILSFDLKDKEDADLFAAAAQTYLLSHLGRSFDSLDFYQTLRRERTDTKKEDPT